MKRSTPNPMGARARFFSLVCLCAGYATALMEFDFGLPIWVVAGPTLLLLGLFGWIMGLFE